MAMCSLLCCALTLPVLLCAGTFLTSFSVDGWARDLLPHWQVASIPDLSGKVAIVTGPTLNGIGYETCVELSRKGAHVILAGRNKKKGSQALAALRDAVPKASAEFSELDLGSLASVKKFADNFIESGSALHMLVNNAGVMMNPFTLTVDSLESQFATNHLGHYLLTRLLLPVLERSAPSRVVSVSSAAAYFPGVLAMAESLVPGAWMPEAYKNPGNFSLFLKADSEPLYSPVAAYGRSKLANVLFARGLDRRLQAKSTKAKAKVYVNAVHPGGIKTNLARHLLDRFSSFSFDGLLDATMDALLMEPKSGAVTQLYLATSPDVELKNIRGMFYKPQAVEAAMPAFAEEAHDDELWRLSEELVKDYL